MSSRASLAGGAPTDSGPQATRRSPATGSPHEGAAEPGAAVLVFLAATVALVPLLAPKLPANAAPVDVLMVASIFAVFVWALRTKARVRVPYVVPTTALMVIGLASALLSALPMDGTVAVAQEIFLLAWCAAVATLCRTPRALRVVLRTWAISATAWAGLLCVAVATGADGPLGATNGGGVRFRLFFDHPNMAGNYFVIAMFVVLASGYPRRRLLRFSCYALLLVATLLTGSNAALLSLAGGAVVVLFLHVRARSGLIKATALSALVVGVLSVGWLQVGEPLLAAAQQSDSSLLRYSVGRGAKSAEGRVDLFTSQFELYERGHLLGIGPTATQATLDQEGATIVKEAHNDYLGTLVERGPFGLLAVFGLMAAIIARIVALTRRPLPPRLAAAIPVPAALAGACAAFAATAMTHEVLHYRWFWTLLGILAAVHLLQGAGSRASAGAGSTALVRRSTPRRPPSSAR
jgi:O-antigen ligase